MAASVYVKSVDIYTFQYCNYHFTRSETKKSNTEANYSILLTREFIFLTVQHFLIFFLHILGNYFEIFQKFFEIVATGFIK